MTEGQSKGQSAYQVGHSKSASDVDSAVTRAMYLYLTRDLGLSERFATTRSAAECEREIPRAVVDELTNQGVALRGRSVLDLGAGLGAMSEELVLRGARTIAIEPGTAWASLAARRAGRHGGSYMLLQAVGENLPLEDRSVDVVISLQVLEHVQDPRRVLQEVARVLKPGGYLYLACENYLAFREGHYKIFWVPLMPKSLASVYLRARGRSPQFLLESVTYVTFPQIMKWAGKSGLVRCEDVRLLQRVAAKRGPLGTLLRSLTRLTSGRAPLIADRARRSFRFGVRELFCRSESA